VLKEAASDRLEPKKERRRRYWQGNRSLAASRDHRIQRQVRRGRSLRDIENLEIVAWENPSPAEEQMLRGPGFIAETPEEAELRAMATRASKALAPLLTRREIEAVGLYLWGDRYPTARKLWQINDFDGMLFTLLAEHPPWSDIAAAMKRTRNGNQVSRGKAATYLKSATKKVGIEPHRLREATYQGPGRLPELVDSQAAQHAGR
jgi:hypothetical protein